jgi:glucan-binding YG repeat protein
MTGWKSYNDKWYYLYEITDPMKITKMAVG